MATTPTTASHDEVMKFIGEQFSMYPHSVPSPNSDLTFRVMQEAIRLGRLDIVKYMMIFERINHKEKLCPFAAMLGQLDILKYLHSECPWDESTCDSAVRGCSLKCLKYAHENGCPWNTKTYRIAEKIGCIDILDYLRDNKCPQPTDVKKPAPEVQQPARKIQVGRVDYKIDPYKETRIRVLLKDKMPSKYNVFYSICCESDDTFEMKHHIIKCEPEFFRIVITNTGCKVQNITIMYRAECVSDEERDVEITPTPPQDMVKNSATPMLPTSAKATQLDENIGFIKDLQDPKLWNETTMCNAVERKNIALVKYLHEHGCPWSDKAVATAAGLGERDILGYLLGNGCPTSPQAIATAAETGRLDIVRLLHELGCHWDKSACRMAAHFGYLDILGYLHERGCPWSKGTIKHAMQQKQFDCLKYAVENDCPWE